MVFTSLTSLIHIRIRIAIACPLPPSVVRFGPKSSPRIIWIPIRLIIFPRFVNRLEHLHLHSILACPLSHLDPVVSQVSNRIGRIVETLPFTWPTRLSDDYLDVRIHIAESVSEVEIIISNGLDCIRNPVIHILAGWVEIAQNEVRLSGDFSYNTLKTSCIVDFSTNV
jgi:hypothetical protein